MELTSPRVVRDVLQRHGIRLRTSLGQNFLVDPNVLQRIVAAAELTPESHVLEVGAGIGTLTRALAARAGRVLVVELDQSLRPVLQETLSGLQNVHVVYGDVLRVDLRSLLGAHCRPPCHVVANIPYQITSPLLGRLLAHRDAFRRLVLMLQEEVAQRLLASPGSKDYSALTVFARFYCHVERVTSVSRHCFLPSPRVDSAVVRIDLRDEPVAPVDDEKLLFATVRAAFGTRRKTLANALSAGLARPRSEIERALRAAGIDP
ncbi:MAG: 16S rRNA (adenine(1518)-N(6)/adenine(1519)-N(6))-dimethyltransferase RsmA, partial [Armatimonadota bacterium]|nr:16S rRNA (adenine(1518)-N(6)/adenine(1519)-N(6))-dimethyltransferase RsmA [Armatimonadota bacterium]